MHMTTVDPATELDYYAAPGRFTDLATWRARLDALPRSVAELARTVQGVLIHRAWAGAYGVTPTAERNADEGLHAAAAIVRRIFEIDGSEIAVARPPDRRAFANCRHFATLLCAFLRHRGVPARARCGFARYFEPEKYVDHWVSEYWDPARARWVLADAQVDALQRGFLKLDFDPLDVPRDRFWPAGVAWQHVEAGEASGDCFGIAHMWGQWYIRGNIWLDAASLNKVELLPWDVYGLAKKPAEEMTTGERALFDRVVTLTASGDARATAEVRALWADGDALRPPEEMLAKIDAADRGEGTGANPLAGTP
jgi:hypothetical protein